MSRPLPKPRVYPKLTAMAVFEPNGAHRMEVFVPRLGADVAFDRDEVAQLEEKIAAFKQQSAFEDGRPIERTHRHREAL